MHIGFGQDVILWMKVSSPSHWLYTSCCILVSCLSSFQHCLFHLEDLYALIKKAWLSLVSFLQLTGCIMFLVELFVGKKGVALSLLLPCALTSKVCSGPLKWYCKSAKLLMTLLRSSSR